MAMFDSTNFRDSQGRSRRVRHLSGKNYDGEGERSLELRGILEVLSVYHDYEGGINCCVCGKLYKSKVCFIKHLWEHSVYWNQFPGDKNHERVLAIQAALILYSKHYGVSYRDAEKMTELLVTAPSFHEPTCTKTEGSNKPKEFPASDFTDTPYQITPQKDSDRKQQCPSAPKKMMKKDLNRKRTGSMMNSKSGKKRRLDFGGESGDYSASETLLQLRTATL